MDKSIKIFKISGNITSINIITKRNDENYPYYTDFKTTTLHSTPSYFFLFISLMPSLQGCYSHINGWDGWAWIDMLEKNIWVVNEH